MWMGLEVASSKKFLANDFNKQFLKYKVLRKTDV